VHQLYARPGQFRVLLVHLASSECRHPHET